VPWVILNGNGVEELDWAGMLQDSAKGSKAKREKRIFEVWLWKNERDRMDEVWSVKSEGIMSKH
jgi:hypothetical protein